jgi:hypothetical protein
MADKVETQQDHRKTLTEFFPPYLPRHNFHQKTLLNGLTPESVGATLKPRYGILIPDLVAFSNPRSRHSAQSNGPILLCVLRFPAHLNCFLLHVPSGARGFSAAFASRNQFDLKPASPTGGTRNP